jgi:telomere-associated protein RIF1
LTIQVSYLQVAWEGLIDALVYHPILASQKKTPAMDQVNGVSEKKTPAKSNSEDQVNGVYKSIKLIMTPLIGIMSSKCDISVHSSCLNTWCYLLHKLDTSVNESSLIKMVLEPILKAIFQNGPDSKTICLWNLGLDLLSDSISQKCTDVSCIETGHSSSGKSCWKQHPIRWLPWDISQLNFYLSIIFVIIRQASGATVTCDHRSHVYDVALKLFTYILKGVKLDMESPSTNYDGVIWCLNTLLTFVKKVCEDVYLDGSENYDVYYTSLRFIDAITKELGSSILASPLYKFSLDLKYIKDIQSVDHNKHLKFLTVDCISYMDKVSPLVYLTVLYFHMMVQLTLKSQQSDHISQGMSEYFKFIFSSSDPLDNLLTCIGLMYKHVEPIYINIWIAVAQGLNYCVYDANCKSLKESLSDSIGYSSISSFLIYPIVVHAEIPRLTSSNASASMEKHPLSLERKPELELVIQTWKSLYGSLSACFGCSTSTNFSGDLCKLINRWLDENIGMLESGTDLNLTCNDIDLSALHLSGNFLICILEQIQTSELVSETNRSKSECDNKILYSIKNCLTFASK